MFLIGCSFAVVKVSKPPKKYSKTRSAEAMMYQREGEEPPQGQCTLYNFCTPLFLSIITKVSSSNNKSNLQLSVEINPVSLWFCLTLPSDCSRKLLQLSRPIGFKSETNLVFPCFRHFCLSHFEFSSRLCGIFHFVWFALVNTLLLDLLHSIEINTISLWDRAVCIWHPWYLAGKKA